MKKKILKYYIVLILVVLTVTIIFTSHIAQKYYKHEVENKLSSIGFSIEYYLMELKDSHQMDFDSIAKEYAGMHNRNISYEKEEIRITFIDFSGKVVGDSQADYHVMENHLDRNEVQKALKEGWGKDIRYSRTVKADFLYVAIPLTELNVIVRVSVPLIQLNNIVEMIWFYSMLTILSGLILAVLLSLRIANTLVNPLKDMILASKEISNGNYSKRIMLKSKDELGQLADHFNDMASRLEKTVLDLNNKKIEVESIVNSITNGIVAVDDSKRVILINPAACNVFNIETGSISSGDNISDYIRNSQINLLLEDTITENRSHEGEITLGDKILSISTFPFKPDGSEGLNGGGIIFIQDITKMRKLEQLRTEFVSNVTHELKTPITSIRGFIETLKNGSITNEKVAVRFLDIIDIEAERLYALINDILQLSEIESKLKDTDLERLCLKYVIDDVFEVLQNIAQEKNIHLYNNVDEELFIKANRNRMKQLILNLVDNGIKYNKPNGSVTIEAKKDAGKTVIFVRDTGIGIPKEHTARVFERFYRVDRGRSRDMGGTGLGLSIVKHIVNLYNGDIKVNTEVGKGTEFIIQLP